MHSQTSKGLYGLQKLSGAFPSCVAHGIKIGVTIGGDKHFLLCALTTNIQVVT